jgi:sarcosine oxidase subunit delta
MLCIECPWCGSRDEAEYGYGGEAHRILPAGERVSDADWAAYLYLRRNPKGLHRERWVHAAGCGRWFNVVRDTRSGAIAAVYRSDAEPPGADHASA